ncbi:ribitol-5-phosphate transferase FKTN [Centroberyx gerrardi]
MPRLNKTAILALLVATSSVFLLFQLYYYRQYVSKPGPHILTRTGQLTASDLQWQTVKKFLSLVRRFDWPLFLADSASLGRLSQDALLRRDGQLREPHCSFLCTGRPIMSFALLANLWKYDATLLSAAEQKGFQLLQLRGKDPRLASLDDLSGEEIPLHFLFRLQGQVIQVVFLYERSGNYLWHGALRLKPDTDRSFTDFKKLDYGHHAGAYDRPELVLTTLDGLDIRIPRNISRFLSERSHARFLECRYRDARNFLQLLRPAAPLAAASRGAARFSTRLLPLSEMLDKFVALLPLDKLSNGRCFAFVGRCKTEPRAAVSTLRLCLRGNLGVVITCGSSGRPWSRITQVKVNLDFHFYTLS